MSTSRGSCTRNRPQKHQNKTAFKNNLYDTSNKTKLLNNLQVTGVCKRCKEIIDWKIKYKKYKPLTAPRKCTNCDQKTIKYAYHVLCSKCASEKKNCAKCCKSIENDEHEEDNESVDIKSLLTSLPERKRRTILRHINKQDGEEKLSSEIKAHIEDILSKSDKLTLQDSDLDTFLGEEFSNSDDDNDE